MNATSLGSPVVGALTAEENLALATTPAGDPLALRMLHPDPVTDPLHADPLAKRSTRYEASPRPLRAV
jgi:hypothetical protein